VEDQEAYLRAKVYVSIHQKNAFKVVKLKVAKKSGVIYRFNNSLKLALNAILIG
jgi:hypothetical protein